MTLSSDRAKGSGGGGAEGPRAMGRRPEAGGPPSRKEGFGTAAADETTAVSPIKQKVIYMIGNGHIDPVWQWQWPEGMQEVHATFRSALDRMKEYPEFKFTASSAAFYEWVEKGDPKMFAEIKERVARGRWEGVGGWGVETWC